MQINVRPAGPIDAEAAAEVLCASISALCIEDHGNDPKVLARWLANKTPDNVRTWIEAPGRVVVAENRDRFVGIGAAIPSGEILLNYVLPEARFRGVSKAVLCALEAYLRGNGRARSTLCSTRTAHRLYRAAGYVDSGAPETWDGVAAYPMTKDLSVEAFQHDEASHARPAGG